VSTVIQQLHRKGFVAKAGEQKNRRGRHKRYYRLTQSEEKLMQLWKSVDAFSDAVQVETHTIIPCSMHYDDAVKGICAIEIGKYEGDTELDKIEQHLKLARFEVGIDEQEQSLPNAHILCQEARICAKRGNFSEAYEALNRGAHIFYAYESPTGIESINNLQLAIKLWEVMYKVNSHEFDLEELLSQITSEAPVLKETYSPLAIAVSKFCDSYVSFFKQKIELAEKKDIAAVPTIRLQKEQTLKIGHCFSMSGSFHPIKNKTGVLPIIYALTFEPLIAKLQGERLEGRLAYNWNWDEEKQAYVFDLYQNVLFHDNIILKAKHVKWAYERYLEEIPYFSNLVKSVDIINDFRIQIKLNRKCELIELPMQCIFKDSESPIGTGPFIQIDKDSTDSTMFFNVNKNHYRRPLIREVWIRRYKNIKELSQALNDGEVNFAIGVYEEGEKFRAVKRDTGVLGFHLIFNMAKSLCQKKEFRQAVSYAIDRVAIVKQHEFQIYEYYIKALHNFFKDAPAEDIKVDPKYDLEKARKLLPEEIKDTKIYITSPSGNPYHAEIIESIKMQLRNIGVNAYAVKNEVGHLILSELNTYTPEIECRIWHSKGDMNIGGYKNSNVDNLINRIGKGEKKERLYSELRSLVEEESPTIPLFGLVEVLTYVRNLRATGAKPILSNLDSITCWYFEKDIIANEEYKEYHLA
jgi:ABC-type transport system substrate-binding protein/DNA-binding PadR family transcriptional regulator